MTMCFLICFIINNFCSPPGHKPWSIDGPHSLWREALAEIFRRCCRLFRTMQQSPGVLSSVSIPSAGVQAYSFAGNIYQQTKRLTFFHRNVSYQQRSYFKRFNMLLFLFFFWTQLHKTTYTQHWLRLWQPDESFICLSILIPRLVYY